MASEVSDSLHSCLFDEKETITNGLVQGRTSVISACRGYRLRLLHLAFHDLKTCIFSHKVRYFSSARQLVSSINGSNDLIDKRCGRQMELHWPGMFLEKKKKTRVALNNGNNEPVCWFCEYIWVYLGVSALNFWKITLGNKLNGLKRRRMFDFSGF